MNVRGFVFAVVVGGAIFFGAVRPGVAAPAAGTRPNVVVILADDQGWGDLSIDGNANLRTPRVDSLARDGAMFERFFVCPVCSPTRAEFLTGRYHPRGGVHGVTRGGERLDLDEKTIADAFHAAGYATAAFGKWHNGTQYPYHPTARGFDDFYGFCSGHWGKYFDPILEHNGRLVRGKGFIIDDLTDHALSFIEANQERPFFCYVPMNTPHSPFQVPQRFYDRFSDAPIKMRNRDPRREDLIKTRCVLAMCENIDWNVGRILDKLDELKLTGRTIVVYFSDNGPNTWRYNGGMKGKKGSTDEGGVRVPCFIRWPGHITPGRRIPRIAAAIDLLPTLTELVGIPVVGGKPLDGKSVRPLLFGTAKNWPDRMIFSHWAGKVSVATEHFRLDYRGALFDLSADPGQRRDVAARRPKLAAKLTAAVTKWKAEMLPQIAKDERPFPVGYAEFPTTVLPARDGVASGKIRRSARAPNCSFFTHWTSAEDHIAWDVKVATRGDYEAVVYYTCAKADVGSTIELSLGDAKVHTVVDKPNDPPLVGAEADRAPRGGESYVKDFRPLRLGVLTLNKGRGELNLHATKKSGQQVIDVRAVTLRLIK